MKKRILICGFHQETNTFNPFVNEIQRFNAGDVFEGERIFARWTKGNTTIHGAVDAIAEAGGEVIPTIFMHSGSGGRVADEALNHFCERLRYYIETVGEFDGVYAELHGATCTQSEDDACGYILELIRSLVGNKPVTASCDLHAKITQKMLRNADCISGYQTYPHVDFYQTGYRAAKRCIELLAEEKNYYAVCQIPVLLPPAGYTTASEPFKSLIDSGKSMVADGMLVDFSIFVVQPWLDVQEIASTVLTVAKDPEIAKQKAEELAKGLLAIKEGMWPDLVAVDKIIDIAEANKTGKPVILADSADSPNGGCVGDSPVAVMRIRQRGSMLKTAISIRDPESVEQAFQMGVGATGEFTVGGKMTPGIPGPFKAVGTVLGLYKNDPINGKHPKLGKVATVRFGNIYIVLCTAGSSSNIPEQYQDFGIEPAECDLIVIKANTSFRAFYAHLTDLIYVADTPGAGASNLRQLDWKNLPKGMYPFDLSENYIPPEATLW